MGQRTPAMTAFGVMSVAIGVFFAVWSLRMLTMGSGATSAEVAGTAGWTAILIWLGGLVAGALLIGSGVGCLNVAPWARPVGLAACAVGLVALGSWMWASSFSAIPALGVAYKVVFGAVNLSPSWKNALRGASGRMPHRLGSPSSGLDDNAKAAA